MTSQSHLKSIIFGSLSNFRCELRKAHHLCRSVRYGRSTSSKVVNFGTNWNGVLDFLVPIVALALYLAPFLRYGDLFVENRQFFSTSPSFRALDRGDPFRISGKVLRILKVVFRGTDSDNFVISACLLLIESQERQTDGQTDGQTPLS